LSEPGFSNIFGMSSYDLHKIVRAERIQAYDSEGRRYIDGSAGPICVNISARLVRNLLTIEITATQAR
jgi:adenosylmethionine-8-amino-7-oxononanoate aminotransferase